MTTQNVSSFLSNEKAKVFLVVMNDSQEREGFFQKLISKDQSVERLPSDIEMHLLFDALLTPSLFGEERVLILDDCDKMTKQDVEKLGVFLEKNCLSCLLLLGSKGKTPLIKVIEKVGSCLDLSGEKPWEKQKRIHDALKKIAQDEGKWLSNDGASLLIEKIGPDLGALSQEVRKLCCFVGERQNIERTDVFRNTCTNLKDTPWKQAEEIIWDGTGFTFDPAGFIPLIFSLRAQLQMGEKIMALTEANIPMSQWSSFFPKVWPKTLEKRKSQAVGKPHGYFKKGLETLFKIEMLSRSGARPQELFDLFRTSLRAHG